ncbi:MFS transporter [Streptomyces hiroshimensis]|uniref:MFS transporter n=1 Tax=Streptomyces hiroshimensis TaxID=66424 RepID=A0ABQ2YI84_9ACTN|nr:MFS transporter [Streptomyces hiroshimensis]GGX83908.1 MFS transporter [Streptomyces hiroshimensis]
MSAPAPAPAEESRKPAQEAPVVRLWLAAFCGYLSLGATLQTLPSFTEDRFHAVPWAVAAVVGIASLAAAVCRPFAGRAVDAGQPRRTVVLGAACGALGGLGHLWSPSLPVLVLARLLLGAGEGILFTSAVSWVMRGSADGRRARVAGWFGLSMWGGLSAGPVLAGLLHAWHGDSAVWGAVTLLPLVGMALAISTRNPPRQPAAPARGALLPRGSRLPGLAYLLTSYGYGAISTVLLLYLQHAHIGGGQAALAVFAVAFLVARAVGSPMVDRLGGVPAFVVAAVAEACGLLILGCRADVVGALLGTAVTGAGVALLYPAMIAVIVGRSPQGQQGAAVGVMISFWDLGITVSGFISGTVAGALGYGWSFVLSAGLSVAGAAITVCFLRAGRRTPERPAPARDAEPTAPR